MLEIVITPTVEPEALKRLSQTAAQLDRRLDDQQTKGPIAPTGILQEFGARLWQIAGLESETLRAKLAEAKSKGSPLQLTIEGEAMQHLPWEILYHEHPEIGFLGRHPWCAVVRRVRAAQPSTDPLPPLPLKLLLFVASPEDLDAEKSRLDYEEEEALLYEALDHDLTGGTVDIDVAEDGRLETLIERLEQRYYHAVLLSMHGTQAPSQNGTTESGLLFEHAETGHARPIAGSHLQQEFEKLLADRRPGLVVLSACQSALMDESAESIASVALRLHDIIPRVIGMRQSVMDAAASVFGAEFFRRLSLGERCSRALSLARDKMAQGTWLQGQEGRPVQRSLRPVGTTGPLRRYAGNSLGRP